MKFKIEIKLPSGEWKHDCYMAKLTDCYKLALWLVEFQAHAHNGIRVIDTESGHTVLIKD